MQGHFSVVMARKGAGRAEEKLFKVYRVFCNNYFKLGSKHYDQIY